jgi:SNF2 family DNA or RNA helicase
MPTAGISDGRIAVNTTYHDRHLMAELPGSRFRDGSWSAPLTWATCVTLRGLFGSTLTISEELQDWAWMQLNSRLNHANAIRDQLEAHVDTDISKIIDGIEVKSTRRLFDYQRVDVDFLITNERGCLFNPPGLGKSGVVVRTIQALVKKQSDVLPVLVICPNSLKLSVWAEEFKIWNSGLNVQVVHGGAAERRKQLAEPADVFILNWEAVRLHSRLAPYGSIELSDAEKLPKELNAMKFGTVVLDEAHKLKDPRSKQTRAVWSVTSQAHHRFALTGTPIANNIGDLWAILHAVEPEWFPGKTKFLDRYAVTHLNFFGGFEVMGINPATRQELFRIIDPLMRRIPKAAALPQLPPKLPPQYRYTYMTPRQMKLYRQMQDEMVAQLDQLLVAPNPLSQLTRLVQFASASAELDAVGKVRLSTPSSKVDDLAELLEEMGDEPLVVAAMSRQLIELAAAKLADLKISYGLVTGTQSAEERQRAVRQFQDGKIRVILLTISAGGEGITLTRADTICFMQRSWSHIQNEQCEDRIHRIGSEIHDCIRVIVQVTPGTVEERVLEVIAEKGEFLEEVTRDRATMARLLGMKGK